jgi:hypothetical protein
MAGMPGWDARALFSSAAAEFLFCPATSADRFHKL